MSNNLCKLNPSSVKASFPVDDMVTIVKAKLLKGKKKYTIGVYYSEAQDFIPFSSTKYTSSQASKKLAKSKKRMSHTRILSCGDPIIEEN